MPLKGMSACLVMKCTDGAHVRSGIVGVASADDLVDETAVGIQVIEVPAATKEQCIFQRFLEMPVRTLNGAILVCNTQVIPGRVSCRNGASTPDSAASDPPERRDPNCRMPPYCDVEKLRRPE
jgi:hypothetical protein